MTAITRNGIHNAAPPSSKLANDGLVCPIHSQPECTNPAPVSPNAMIVKNVSYVIVGHPHKCSTHIENGQKLYFSSAGRQNLLEIDVLAHMACNRHTNQMG